MAIYPRKSPRRFGLDRTGVYGPAEGRLRAALEGRCARCECSRDAVEDNEEEREEARTGLIHSPLLPLPSIPAAAAAQSLDPTASSPIVRRGACARYCWWTPYSAVGGPFAPEKPRRDDVMNEERQRKQFKVSSASISRLQHGNVSFAFACLSTSHEIHFFSLGRSAITLVAVSSRPAPRPPSSSNPASRAPSWTPSGPPPSTG